MSNSKRVLQIKKQKENCTSLLESKQNDLKVINSAKRSLDFKKRS